METNSLWPHQAEFLKRNPPKALLAWEMRTGKSLPASIWIDLPEQAGNTYIITLKKNKEAWRAFGTKATVLTKEEFKKSRIDSPTAIVVDEAHNFGSPLFVKGRSQQAAALYTLLKKNPDCHVLLLTATPIKNNAWSLHTLLCYIGVYIDWRRWRDMFFEQVIVPFAPYPIWQPRKDWRERIKPYYEKYCDIVNLADIVEYLPPAETRVVRIKQKKYARTDPEATWHDEHLHEQHGKAQEILALGYKKVIVVCYYTQQIDELAVLLATEKPVYVLDGRTKDQEAVIRQAQQSDECYFIVQSSCGEGWDGYMFSAMIFASQAHSVVQHTQMLGRQRHPKHLKVTETIFLLGGRWDEKVYKTVCDGYDFYGPTKTAQKARS